MDSRSVKPYLLKRLVAGGKSNSFRIQKQTFALIVTFCSHVSSKINLKSSLFYELLFQGDRIRLRTDRLNRISYRESNKL